MALDVQRRAADSWREPRPSMYRSCRLNIRPVIQLFPNRTTQGRHLRAQRLPVPNPSALSPVFHSAQLSLESLDAPALLPIGEVFEVRGNRHHRPHQQAENQSDE
jgi:hypothetical protein